ncbi:MAG: ATP-binding cassette domain-containing protein [Acidobacteriota bacterium]
MLELKNLTKRYNRVPAVENLDITLAPGEVYGYLGPNGSGKSTTVKRVARTARFAVRGSCVAMVPTVSYGIAASRLRRPFLSESYFFLTVAPPYRTSPGNCASLTTRCCHRMNGREFEEKTRGPQNRRSSLPAWPIHGPGQASGSMTLAMHPFFEWTACPDCRPLPKPQT